MTGGNPRSARVGPRYQSVGTALAKTGRPSVSPSGSSESVTAPRSSRGSQATSLSSVPRWATSRPDPATRPRTSSPHSACQAGGVSAAPVRLGPDRARKHRRAGRGVDAARRLRPDGDRGAAPVDRRVARDRKEPRADRAAIGSIRPGATPHRVERVLATSSARSAARGCGMRMPNTIRPYRSYSSPSAERPS